jgi:uridine kinase
MKDERADRERTPGDISVDLQAKAAEAVKTITVEINRRMVQKSSPVLVAIDGGSGAGKSTIVLLTAAEIAAVVVQGDDFCRTEIDWGQMSPAEKATNCIDWQRARRDALEPLLSGKPAAWHPFNFATGIGLADYFVLRKPAPVVILDGIYSSSPILSDIIDLTVLIDVPTDVRYARHNDREGHDDADWHKVWDEAEAYYFTHVRPASSFDLVISHCQTGKKTNF